MGYINATNINHYVGMVCHQRGATQMSGHLDLNYWEKAPERRQLWKERNAEIKRHEDGIESLEDLSVKVFGIKDWQSMLEILSGYDGLVKEFKGLREEYML
jgi:hypothetical protein